MRAAGVTRPSGWPRSPGRPGGWAPTALPAGLVLAGAVSVQSGAGIAARLFSQLPPAAVTTLRLWSAALILLIVAGRGSARAAAGLARRRAWADSVITLTFGIALGFMNFAIYQAFARIPLGIAVTIEFLGPLTVTVTGTLRGGGRRAAGLGYAALAAAGVLLLAGTAGGTRLNWAGVAWAAAAGAAWAAYILGAKAAGQRLPGASGLVIAMCVAAVAVTGPGLAVGGTAMFRPSLLAAGAAVGVLSSVIPYWLELEALRRISDRPVRRVDVGAARRGRADRPGRPRPAAIGHRLGRDRLRGRRVGGRGRGDPRRPGPGTQRDARSGRERSVSIVRVLMKIAGLVWRPTPRVLRGWALASVVANAVIISTGAAVRVSSSGLGCPDWPSCTKSSAVAAHSVGQTTLNTWIEFGNRLLNFPLVAIAGLTFIAFLRYYRASDRSRKDLVWLSALLPLGVIAQAVLGGILVLLKLPPALVAAHFLLSTAVILSAAVVLHRRACVLAGAGTAPASAPPVRRDLRVLAGLLTGVTGLMLAAGTVVTGTGPLAGTTIDSHGRRTTVPRFHFSLASVTQLHADIGWFIVALTVALVIGLRFAGGSRRTVRLGWTVLGGLCLQGAIGYAQYFNHLPAGLVWVHVSVAVLIWIFVLQLFLSTGTGLPRGGTGATDAAADLPAGGAGQPWADDTPSASTSVSASRSPRPTAS